MKRAIVTDSTFYLPKEFIEENNIISIPLSINFEDESFSEMGDIVKLNERIFTKIDHLKVLPKSSQPTTYAFVEQLEALINDGVNEIIIFCVSSKLSGTYQGAILASKTIMEQFKDIKIKVVDTLLAAQASGIVIQEYFRITNNIKRNLSFKEIDMIVDFYKINAQVYLFVDNLNYLVYGGRVNSKIATIGDLFGVKPILKLVDGELIEFDKVLSTKKALKLLSKKALDEINMSEQEYYFITTHVLAKGNATKLNSYVNRKGNCNISNGYINQLGPVISIHVGVGAIGVVWAPLFGEINE